MKITILTNDVSCAELAVVNAAHICMFERDYTLQIHFIVANEQMKFIETCIDNYVGFECKGRIVTLLHEKPQRVRFRFD